MHLVQHFSHVLSRLTDDDPRGVVIVELVLFLAVHGLDDAHDVFALFADVDSYVLGCVSFVGWPVDLLVRMKNLAYVLKRLEILFARHAASTVRFSQPYEQWPVTSQSREVGLDRVHRHL